MAQTPEGKVKARVKKMLREHGAYFFMPVQHGYGTVTLDFLVCLRGRFLAIETKAPGKKPTALQSICMNDIKAAGGHAMVVDGTSYEELDAWLKTK